MKRRIVVIILTLALCLGLCPAVTAAGGDAQTVSLSAIPDRKGLEKLLYGMDYFRDNSGGKEYSCLKANTGASDLFSNLIGLTFCADWADYPGRGTQEYWNAKDPLRKFDWLGLGYRKFDKAQADWIGINIFNCPQEDWNALRTANENKREGGNVCMYTYGDSYYHYLGGIGWMGWTLKLVSAKTDGEYYYVAYDTWNEYWDSSRTVTRYYATVGQKTLGGKTYWTLYANSEKGFVDVAEPRADGDWSKVSNWAEEEVREAAYEDLLPKVLRGYDMTRPISRAEFAAVAVAVYEKLTGGNVRPAPAGTFSDTDDLDVRKAAAIGVVNGVGNGKYAPKATLTREQAATMLTRVWQSWKDTTDLPYWKLDDFADHRAISDWAADGVYFMNANNVIRGTGERKFSPRATATREQALLIALRMVKKFGRGDVRYNWVVSDLSWTDAFRKARDCGGTLARFDSTDDFFDCVYEIYSYDFDTLYGRSFRFGARWDEDKGHFYMVDADNEPCGSPLETKNSWAYRCWDLGEPSYEWNGHKETTISFRLEGEENWPWSDMADQVYQPGQGLYGFILEFEN